mmetsp:Transcript_55303/g.135442  ORF Transcript_55303/g.135442 Transcript_55303/m.135442 type:complete len:248 (-) Transcript_55303:341-1084(-)
MLLLSKNRTSALVNQPQGHLALLPNHTTEKQGCLKCSLPNHIVPSDRISIHHPHAKHTTRHPSHPPKLNTLPKVRIIRPLTHTRTPLSTAKTNNSIGIARPHEILLGHVPPMHNSAHNTTPLVWHPHWLSIKSLQGSPKGPLQPNTKHNLAYLPVVPNDRPPLLVNKLDTHLVLLTNLPKKTNPSVKHRFAYEVSPAQIIVVVHTHTKLPAPRGFRRPTNPTKLKPLIPNRIVRRLLNMRPVLLSEQ